MNTDRRRFIQTVGAGAAVYGLCGRASGDRGSAFAE